MITSLQQRFVDKLSLTTVLLFLLVVLGVFFRVRQYVFDRSLWLDEALLSENIVELPLDRLLTQPLAHDQAAPLGLLLLAKLSVMSFGETDLALRLVPLLFGILAVFLSVDASRHAFQSDIARVTFVGLVAVAPILVYYSSEIKQYGIDASISMLLLWAGLKFKTTSAKSLVALALVGMLAVWLSHPSVFVLAAIGATFLIQQPIPDVILSGAKNLIASDETLRSAQGDNMAERSRNIKPALAVAVVIAVWLANFWIDYAISLGAIARDDFLVNYWRSGYAPLSLDALAWSWESALGLVYLAFRQTDLTVVPALPQWFDVWNIILLIVIIAGLAALFKSSRQLFSIVVLAILVTAVVSAFRLYPFRNRLILFLAPMVFIAAGSAMDWLARWRMPTAWFAGAVLVSAVAAISIPVAIQPHNLYDIKGALNYIRAHRAPGDAVALQFWSDPAFHFYAKSFGLDDMPLVATMTMNPDVDKLLQSICADSPPRRTWIIFSHMYEEHVAVVERLRAVAPQVDAWEGDNAGTFLFDFSNLGAGCSP